MWQTLLTTPVAHAALAETVYRINRILINPFIVFLFATALVVFLFGIVEYLANSGNEEKRTQGKRHMIWGIFGLFIMTAVFGITQLIVTTLGADVDTQG